MKGRKLFLVSKLFGLDVIYVIKLYGVLQEKGLWRGQSSGELLLLWLPVNSIKQKKKKLGLLLSR